MNAESLGSLLTDLARVAQVVGVADPAGVSLESARRLREHLDAQDGEGLLVFDNANDPESLRPFVPVAGGMQIVITSTNQAFAQFGAEVDVATFSRPESLKYLRARTGLGDEGGAAAVAAELGICRWAWRRQQPATISGQRLSYQQYLGRLQLVPVARLLGRVPGSDYRSGTAAALLLNVQALEADDPSGLAGQILRIVAVLSGDGVRRSLLDGLGDVDQEATAAAVERCARWSLLTWSMAGESVIMHRLLARVIREREHAAGQLASTVAAALDLLAPSLQERARDTDTAHVTDQTEALLEVQLAFDPGNSALCRRVLWALSRARHLAGDNPGTALDRRLIADRRSALAECERVLGTIHPDTLAARSQLAQAYESGGQLSEAIGHYATTLTARERWLGFDHPDTLASRISLAHAYELAGWADKAIPLYERILADRRRLLGPDNPDTLAARNDLDKVKSRFRRQ